jgi:transmembrane sensor
MADGSTMAVRAWFPDYETARGEQRHVTLADGSAITIDTDAALSFRRSHDRRAVTLFRGQIVARVVKDKARPFIVETSEGSATAKGTAFVVRREGDVTTVTVIESMCERARQKPAPPIAPISRPVIAYASHRKASPPWPVRSGGGRRLDEGWLAADDQPVTGCCANSTAIARNQWILTPTRFPASGSRAAIPWPIPIARSKALCGPPGFVCRARVTVRPS